MQFYIIKCIEFEIDEMGKKYIVNNHYIETHSKEEKTQKAEIYSLFKKLSMMPDCMSFAYPSVLHNDLEDMQYIFEEGHKKAIAWSLYRLFNEEN